MDVEHDVQCVFCSYFHAPFKSFNIFLNIF